MSTRRELIQHGALVAAAAGLAATAARAQDTAQGQPAILPAFGTTHEPRPLPFDPASLDGLSARLMQSHWENNYRGSVNALNTVRERLAAALDDDAMPAFVYNDLKREHLMRTGSVVLHELYFGNIGGGGARDSELDSALVRGFGSVATWEKEFRRIGAGLGGGSGWVMLAWNRHSQLLENYWMADHMHAPTVAVPLLVMDMYEHSYHMDYGAAAGQYIDAFVRNIDWQAVATRLDQAAV